MDNPSTPKAPAPNGETISFDIDGFKQLYRTFDGTTVAKLGEFYSSAIVFKDPVHQLTGITKLRHYFSGFNTAGSKCHFEFLNQIIDGNQAFLQWRMHYSHPAIKNSQPLTLDGGTLIKFGSHIIYHEDFYDMGAMIYQHVPLLGWVVKKINARIVEAAQ